MPVDGPAAGLLQRATTFPNLEICTGETAEPIQLNQDTITVRIGNSHITTRLLIGADGLNSRTRRWAGLASTASFQLASSCRASWQLARPRCNLGLQRWGIRQHFHLPPWSNYVEVHWQNGLEAYITPCGRNLVNVAFLWDRHRFTPPAAGTL